MTTKRSNTKWFYLIIGAFMLITGFTESPFDKEAELVRITVELERGITDVLGRNNEMDYKFRAKEYKSRFIIWDGSITTGMHKIIDDLPGGQVVDIYISESDQDLLDDEDEDISVRGIEMNGKPLMSTQEFYHNQDMYNLLVSIVTVFTGLMLLLNGLLKVPEKINYLVVGVFLVTIIVLRILETGIY